MTENDRGATWLAQRLGVTRQTVYNWINGIHTPNANERTGIYEITGIPVTWNGWKQNEH